MNNDQIAKTLEQVQPNKIYRLPYNPTAENMARYLFNNIGPKLIDTIEGYDLSMTKVVVWETDNAFAEVTAHASTDTSADGSQQAHTTVVG